MAVGVVPGLTPAQEAVQHRGVEQRLERVVGVEHGRGHPVRGVVGGGQRLLGVAEAVGLVVDDDVARLGLAVRGRRSGGSGRTRACGWRLAPAS